MDKNTPTYRIVHNRIRCNNCGDEIESEYRHDFKYCSCKRVFVDGGHSYLRRGFTDSPDDFTELTVVEPLPEENRQQP